MLYYNLFFIFVSLVICSIDYENALTKVIATSQKA